MKTIALIIAASMLVINMVLGTTNFSDTEHGDKYCAKSISGVLTIMHEGKPISANILLTNGTTLKMDGTIHKKRRY